MKIFLRTLLILFLLLVILAGVLFFTPVLPNIVKSNIEKYGTEILKTDVKVGGVDVSILEGSILISKIEVRNSKGYKEKNAISVEKVFVDSDLSTLFEENMIIDEIKISSSNVYIEKMGKNIKSLLSNNKRFNEQMYEDPAAIKEDKKAEEVKSKKVVIKKFIMQDTSAVVKGAFKLKLPDIVLENLGKEDGSMGVSEVSYEVLDIISVEAFKKLLGDQKDKFKEDIKDIFRDKIFSF